MSAYRETGPYIPERDGDFRDWLDNAAERIGMNPSRFGLSEQDAALISRLSQEYRDAYKVISSPASRTPDAIAFKDAIKASAKGTIRTYAGLIRSNLGVDNAALVAIGLKPRNGSRRPVGPPQSRPILMPVCGFPGETYVRFADETTPASRRKPWGSTQLEIAMAITAPGGTLPTNPAHATRMEVFTKQPIVIEHDPADAGSTLTMWGRWRTARGLDGPWSMPAYFTLVGGGSASPSEALQQMRIPEREALRRRAQQRAA